MSRKSKRSVTTTTRSTDANKIANKVADFNPDYSPVLKDLRRIGTLAGIFVTTLVVLSFFLR